MAAKHEYDAVVIGSGPNGLAAAIALQKEGLSVLIIEGKSTVGGGMRTAELTLPDYWSDICSAVHPMGAGSPFFRQLPLEKFGLEYIDPPILAAHPLDNGRASVLKQSLSETAELLGPDRDAYIDLISPMVEVWPDIAADVLGPLHFPERPFDMLRFGVKALKSATAIARKFKTAEAKALFAGMAAHAMLPLDAAVTAAAGLVLTINGHLKGWPVVKGGSQNLANALAAYFTSLGGQIKTGWMVKSLHELPKAKAVLFDTSPKQLLEIAGEELPPSYRRQLQKFRYGMGVFKVDWALDGPVPFTAPECREAGTLHIGGTLDEVKLSEKETAAGKITEKPFVLLAQQSVFDQTRAPEGKHTLWAYCHVPNGSTIDRTAAIEDQIERFAPGFQDRIIARYTYNTGQMQEYNANYVGGDINGGVLDLRQLFARPALRLSPYATPAKNIYLCSASTPPGGGVHGMCGYYAAKRVLRDHFRK